MPQTPSPDKFLPPVLPPLIERRRLLERLRSNRDRRLVLAVAQPAQGKTTLIAAYLAAEGAPAAWCRLDRADADPKVLSRSLARSLDRALKTPPGAPPASRSLVKAARRETAKPDPTFVDDLVARLPRPAAIVLDGLDALGDAGGAMALVEKLVFAVPDGVQLYLISRRMPSLRLQSFRVGRQSLILDNTDLAFDDDEIRDFLCRHHRFGLSETQVRRIRRDTDGWAGGLVLLAEALARLELKQRAALPDGAAELIIAAAGRFFAEEIFTDQAPAVKKFMLHTALADEIDPQMAADLAGLEDARPILADLVARNLFIQVRYDGPRRDVYRYNPLFLKFLRAQGRTDIPPRQRQRLLRRIGRGHCQRNRSDLAVGCYLEAGDLPQAAQAIKRAALDMTIGDRLVQLGRWIDALPADQRAADPWLLLWQAVARRSPGGVKPIEALQEALAGFEACGDLRGQCFALAYLIETAVFRGNTASDLPLWLTRSKALLKDVGQRPYYTYAKALLWRQLGFGQIFGTGDIVYGLSACRNAQLLARRISDADLQRSAAVITPSALASLGEFAAAEEALAQSVAPVEANVAPECRALHKLGQLHLAMFTGDLNQAGRRLEAVRREIEILGLLFLYPVVVEAQAMLQIQQGAYGEAEATCRHCMDVAVMMSASASVEALALRLRAMVHYHRGDFAAAAGLARQSLEKLAEIDRTGLDSLNTGLLYGIVCGHLDERAAARRALEAALDGFYRMGSPIGTAETHFALALLAEAEERSEAVGAHLAEGLAIVNEKGYRHLIVMRPADVARAFRLVPEPLAADARRFLVVAAPAALNTLPSGPRSSAGSLPPNGFLARCARLPRLEIATLGEFTVRRDGRAPVAENEWHGYQPKLLLKAIIVHGASDVPKDILIDDLWPDTPPEAAGQRFKITLHRLRDALEARPERCAASTYIHLKNHLVSLDPELCCIDAAAFEECCAELRAIDPNVGDEARALALCRQARSLYRGDFLPEESYLPWIEAKRSALRDDYVQVLSRMAGLLESRGQTAETIEILQAIIQAAPTREDILRRLMQHYDARGQRSQALQAYEKFRDFLSTDLDVAPDAATTRLYQRMLDQCPAGNR